MAHPTPGQCSQKQALLDSIKLAISDILVIHNAELEAVLSGDFTTGEATLSRLAQAREQKVLCIERFRQHVSSHGC